MAKKKAKSFRTNAPSKSAQIVNMLRRPNGASIPELMKATGWQTHSVRGFMSGTLKKKQTLEITKSDKRGKDRRYFIKANS